MKLQNMENPESDGGSEETPFFQDQRQSGLHCDHDNRRNHSYPEIILGTFGLNGFSAVKTILNAYRCGYRALDTSSAYGNERFIGMALSLLFLIGGSRKDLFVETKVSNAAQRRGDIYDEVLHQIKILRCGTLDMLLLHWPYPELYQESWKQL